MCCVCVFSSDSFWTSRSLDVPAGVTQEEGHTGFIIHLLSAVRALIFLARSIQPFLSLVDREVEFCLLTIYSFSTRWAFSFLVFSFLVFLWEKSRLPGSNSRPNVSEGYEVPLSYRGDRSFRRVYRVEIMHNITYIYILDRMIDYITYFYGVLSIQTKLLSRLPDNRLQSSQSSNQIEFHT